MSGGIYYVAAQEEEDVAISSGHLKCVVELLDGTSETFFLSKKACGQCLLDLIFDSLNLIEKDFFGLQFQDSHSSSGSFNKWLNGVKSIRKQMPGSQPYRLQFRVRFYPNNSNQMQEEYTRYLLFLQIRKDVMDQRLFCDRDTTVILASYVLQAELGDYDPKKHKTGYVSRFKFIHNQNPQFENDVIIQHLKRRNLAQNNAESEYLSITSHLNCYGVEIFNAMTPEKDIVQIGPSSVGFNVFRNKERITLFIWSSIFKISFKKKKISIQIKNIDHSPEDSTKRNPQIFTFILSSLPVCKTLWQNCVDYHTFFRVKNPPNQNQAKTISTHSRCNLFGSSVTPSFGGRRTMPLIEDIQKRSRTTDRNFIRTPSRSRKLSFGRQNSARISKPDVIGNSVVSHSSITLSSVKAAESRKTCEVQNKCHVFQSQNSLDYTPKQATFDSDNSSVDENDVHNSESIDVLPDSGSFLINDHSLRDHCVKEMSNGSASTLESYRQRKASPMNYHYYKRSSTLSDKNKFKILNKSIDESFDNVDRSIYPGLSSESLSELKLSSNNESLPTLNLSSQTRLPHIMKFANSNINTANNKKSNGFSHSFSSKDHCKRSGKVEKEQDDSEIKLRCDRNKRFGFTIKSTLDRGSPVIIESIEKNMPADSCFPRLNEGDQLLSINGEDVNQLCQDEIVSLIKRYSESGNGEIILKVRPSNYMVDYNTELPGCDIPIVKKSNDRKLSLANLSVESKMTSDPLRESIKTIEFAIENNEVLQQFESVYRKNPGLTMVEAKKLENFAKNRYRDISPYDQTRVILKSNSASDYINASIINMHITENCAINRYIAAQGPLQNTSADFWQMCWEQHTFLIVMLTALSEQGRPKCHKYWPPIYDTIEFGDFQISCLSEYYSEDGGFAIRDLIIYHTPSKKERKVQHMQYISWPDHGVPSVHYEFINFVEKVRTIRCGHLEPIIVHCSAGIGRTGVMITMETAMCLIEANQPVDPIEILQKMRDQRASMIQTAAQYKFVCEAVVKVYKDNETNSL